MSDLIYVNVGVIDSATLGLGVCSTDTHIGLHDKCKKSWMMTNLAVFYKTYIEDRGFRSPKFVLLKA